MSLPVAILAGGLARRLRPLTESIPKALIEVQGKPFAIHQIALLQRNGLTEIVMCVGYLGEQVQSALGDGAALGVHLDYSFDGPRPLGTGGALRKALPLLSESFFVLYGDSYLECDYAAVEAAYLDSRKPALMTVYRNAGRWDRSNVVYRQGLIRAYDKSQALNEMKHIDYGLGVMSRRALEAYPAGEELDLATVYQDLLRGGQLGGYEVSTRFYEIGSQKGLEALRDHLARHASVDPGGPRP